MDTSRFTVRLATTEDAVQMMHIQHDCMDEVYPSMYSRTGLNAWKDRLTHEVYLEKVNSNGWCFVAVAIIQGEETVAGFGHLDLVMDGDKSEEPHFPTEYNCMLHIETLYVDPSYHRRAIGRQLLQEMEQQAKNVGCTRIGLRSSLTAVAFYERVGYSVVEREHFCVDAGFVASILVKDL